MSTTTILENLAVAGIVVLAAGAAALATMLCYWSRDDDAGAPGGDYVSALRTGGQLDVGAGRHRAVAVRAYDQISIRARYQGRHSWDEVPPSIRAAAARLPVAERARLLRWELAGLGRPAATVPRRVRQLQLQLHRRLRELGVQSRAYGPRLGARLV